MHLKLNNKILKYLYRASLGLLIYMPFHVFLATSLGTSLNLLDLAKIAKDVFAFLLFIIVAYMLLDSPMKEVKNSLLFKLILGYIFLSLVYVLIFDNTAEAEVLGLVYNTRFLLIFLVGAILGAKIDNKHKERFFKLAIYAGITVAILGLVQVLALGDNVLRSVGYSLENGTPSVFYVNDQMKSNERAFSTLKDPNSLGVYLLISISFIIYLLFEKGKGLLNDRNSKVFIALLILLSCLALTYSRSAILALAASLLLLLNMYRYKILSIISKKTIFISAGLLILSIFLGLLVFNDSKFVQTTVFHIGEKTPETSNSLRLTAYNDSIKMILRRPFGYGVGSAGPVSVKNTASSPLINENYYLQILVEVGFVGFALFMVILLYVSWNLWLLRRAPYAKPLLASLVGISVAGLFIHTWANEAVAYTWWMLAGLVLSENVLISRTKGSNLQKEQSD